MTTTISSVLLRGFQPDMFAGITSAQVTSWSRANDEWSIVFDGDLTEAERAAVVAVMTSRDDADMANRQALIDALDELQAMTGLNASGTAAASPVLQKVDATVDVVTALAVFVLGRSDL